MFSRIASRLHGNKNSLYALRDSLLDRGVVVRDMVSGNINDQGYLFPPDRFKDILIRASRQCTIYKPDSIGRRSAREAVSSYYHSRGVRFDPDSILLTPGSSLSYWYCFKLLADEGDEILCPQPSYPLFDYIAMLSGVRLVPYRLDERKGWALDVVSLEAGISDRTRAIVLISPHNPTGRVADSGDIEQLEQLAVRYDLAIVSDEVFSEFLVGEANLPRPAEGPAPLVCTLNGFSKMFALPGIKFGWIAVSGDTERVQQAMRSLELISDTFLPVNEIVQAAAPDIFRHGESIRAEFARRIENCWHVAEEGLRSLGGCSYVKPRGGFYVTLRLDGTDEEAAAEEILRRFHLLVHPGYFYDMKQEHLVLSFVQNPEEMHNVFEALRHTLAVL